MEDQLLQEFIVDESLPASYAEDARQWFLPLLDSLRLARKEKQDAAAGPLLLGINGAQGTGKSTLAALLSRLLSAQGYSVANLSIDDFYLSRAARDKLARCVHPLFASRGVPGTHDTKLLRSKLSELITCKDGQTVSLPRFDKARDDCCPRSDWSAAEGPVDFIILEGWFIGLQPQPEASLDQAINTLERDEDAGSHWRRRVNRELAGDYQEIFADLDSLLMLRAPSFDQVYAWRRLQEDKLRARSAPGSSGVMNEVSLNRFIEHFERLTRHCLSTLPERADRVFNLNSDHRVVSCHPPL